MTTSAPDRRPTVAAGDRDSFIAVRKTDLLDALIEHGRITDEASRTAFRQICRVIAAIYHYEYFAELERLRDDYFYFDPEIEPHERLDADAIERAYVDLAQSL